VILLKTKLSQPRRMANAHLADVANSQRDAMVLTYDDIGDVLRIPHQPDAADVIKLASLRIEAASRIGIVHVQRVDDLRYREVISIQARRVQQHLILHRGPTEARIIGHSRNGAIRTLDRPIFDGMEFLRRTIRTLKHVAIDEAAWAEQRRQARSHPRG